MALIDLSKGVSKYLERQLLTRSPATPAAPSGLDSDNPAYQAAPAEGSPLAGDGLLITLPLAVVVSVYANATKTFSGVGSGLCWFYNSAQALWARMPDLDLDLGDASGFTAKTFAPFTNLSRIPGIINWIWNGVTVSGGTDFLQRIDGYVP